MSNKDFYRAFEDKYRGSRELIRERISVYLPFVLPLKEIYPNVEALDIGCGRGEWIELLKENNIPEIGIDLDEGMLNACHTLKLNVEKDNGIEYLKKQKDESKILVSAFHVIEHISFEELQILVNEALRILKPGGLLILETPNPENIKVATENFYFDPTHTKPIPCKLLSFLTEYFGFFRSKVVRVQENFFLKESSSANIMDVITGVSQDYAVIAQKKASESIIVLFDKIFKLEYGLSLTDVVEKFEYRLTKMEAKASEAEAKASEAEAKASEAEVRANDALHHYNTVMNSNSWKIMKPFRVLGNIVRWVKIGIWNWLTFSPTSRPRRVFQKMIFILKHFLNLNPKLKRKIMQGLEYFPALKRVLRSIGQLKKDGQVSGIEQLSSSGKKIYDDLKDKITSQREDR